MEFGIIKIEPQVADLTSPGVDVVVPDFTREVL